MFGPSLALVPLVLPPRCPLLSSSLRGPSLLSLHHCCHCSTRDPPHEQLLVRLGVGGMSSFVIILSPHCSSSSVVVIGHRRSLVIVGRHRWSSSSSSLSSSVVVVVVGCHGRGWLLWSWSVIMVMVSRGHRCLPSLTAHCCCLCLIIIPPVIHPMSSCS
jgi:hypothetical protein